MVETKSVKVDNWGVFFLQKLQNFFNKTDYCDLTLQFMDNSQLKVHRLVLSACTDYFNVLEQQTDCTDDILNMPYDLQADVVVPIVNFMYTGTLEFEVNMYGRLLKTAKDMNMTVLLKLLEAHKRTVDVQPARAPPVLLNKGAAGGGNQYHRAGGASSAYGRGGAGPSGAAVSGAQRYATAAGGVRRTVGPPPAAAVTTSPATKSKAGEPVRLGVRPVAGAAVISHGMRKSGGGTASDPVRVVAKATGSRAAGPTRAADPRPTRFEADQGGDQMESSFDNISYESRPLNIKEESDDGDATSRSFEQLRRGYTGVKRPAAAVERATGDSPPEKKPNIEDVKEYIEAHRLRKKIVEEFNENEDEDEDDEDNAATGDGKRNTSTSEDNLDHQKIISEVLKKYPHLVKSNKNIKLKITQKGQQQTITAPLRKSGGGNNASTAAPTKSPTSSGTKPSPVAAKSTSTISPAGKSQQQATPAASNNKPVIATPAAAPKKIDSKTMHALIAKGAENTTGPWLCLKCGVNGRPISIPSYKGFRRHLINVHKQKIDPKLCEHCGWRSAHKAELHHHVLVVHNISPPADVRFPKCSDCVYVAVDKSDLQAHQLDKHPKSAAAGKASQMLPAAQQHCIYCNKTFADETLLYEHIKNLHKERACEDGLMEDEDEEPTTGSVGRRHDDDDDDDDDEDDHDDDEDYVPPKAVAPAAPISEKRKINVLSSITLPSKGGYVLDNKTRAVASTSTAAIVQQKSVAVAKTSGTSSGRRSGTLDPVTGTFADDDVDDADDDDADEEMPTAGAAKVIKAAAAAPAPEISQEEADSNAYLEFVMAEVHGEKKPCADAAVAAASPSTTSATDADVGTQFVTEEGAAVELTEEQKKELIDQLHDQSGVLLILKDEPSIADESSSTVANDTSSGDLPADTSASGKTADGASQSQQHMSMEWTLESPQKSDDATAKSSATTAAKSSSVADKAKELIGDWSADETDDSMLDDSGKSATLETSTTAGEEATANTTTEQSKEVEDDEEEVAAAIGASTTTAAVAETQEAELKVEVSSGAPLMPKRSYAGRGSRDSNKETDGEEATKSSAVTTKVVKEEEDGDSSHIDEPKRDAETMKKDSNIEIKSLISDWGEDDEDEAMDKD